MSGQIVARRYADALFQLGDEKGSLDQLVDEFRLIKDVFQENELQAFLAHPRVALDKKYAFLDRVFAGFSRECVNTIKLLVKRLRIHIVTSVVDHFIQLVNDAQGIAEATVYSVRPLSDEELKQLEKPIADRFNKRRIVFENIVDPSVLGGVKIRIGNTIMDGSLGGKLKRIERRIVTANY